MSNYHWYLKHAIHFDKSDVLLKFYWDPVQPYVAHYLRFGGLYGRIQFIADIYVSGSLSVNNPATVAVVDGNMLKLTPFRFQNVPPPMSSLTLELSNTISHVSFLASGNGDNICIHTNDGKLSFFESQIKCHKSIQIPSFLGSLQLPDLDTIHYRQVIWVQKDVIVAISYNRRELCDTVAILYLEEENSNLTIRKKVHVCIADHHLSRIHIGHMGEILVQSIAGTVIEIYDYSTADPRYVVRDTFPEFCPWFSSVPIENNEVLYVGMSDSNKLYLNQKLLSAECTSYFIHTHHLLFTTFSHKLCLMPLNSSYQGKFLISLS
jgi:elongator complex protein 1